MWTIRFQFKIYSDYSNGPFSNRVKFSLTKCQPHKFCGFGAYRINLKPSLSLYLKYWWRSHTILLNHFSWVKRSWFCSKRNPSCAKVPLIYVKQFPRVRSLKLLNSLILSFSKFMIDKYVFLHQTTASNTRCKNEKIYIFIYIWCMKQRYQTNKSKVTLS